jgi:biopolymer transport protein TolR
MAAMNGNSKGMVSEINVTPMIDVLLVLLIIFMVIVPSLPRGEAALIPAPSSKAESARDAVVLEVTQRTGDAVSFRINQQPVAPEVLQSRLAAIYATRARRVLFVKGDDHLSFTEVAEVLDISHAAGIDQIGLMTPGIMAGR